MRRLALIPLLTLGVAAGCGGSNHASTYGPTPITSTQASVNPVRTNASRTTTASGPGALQAEANAAAAGDIPDNQVFLVFRNGRAGYSIRYPEGWAQQGSGGGPR